MFMTKFKQNLEGIRSDRTMNNTKTHQQTNTYVTKFYEIITTYLTNTEINSKSSNYNDLYKVIKSYCN